MRALRLFADEAGAGLGSPLARISEEGCRGGCDQLRSGVVFLADEFVGPTYI